MRPAPQPPPPGSILECHLDRWYFGDTRVGSGHAEHFFQQLQLHDPFFAHYVDPRLLPLRDLDQFEFFTLTFELCFLSNQVPSRSSNSEAIAMNMFFDFLVIVQAV